MTPDRLYLVVYLLPLPNIPAVVRSVGKSRDSTMSVSPPQRSPGSPFHCAMFPCWRPSSGMIRGLLDHLVEDHDMLRGLEAA